MVRTMKGRFIPKNPHKYIGDVTKIIFRSSWELNALKFFDQSSAVLKYASEEIKIPYISPIDGKVHNYFPDFIIIYLDSTGAQKKEILEIKPLSQTILTDKSSNHDILAIKINEAKWAAATIFATQRGWIFRIITELSIFKQHKKPPRPRIKTTKTTIGTKPGKRSI